MSLRKAVDMKCRECIYDDKSGLGTWRQQTEACTITDCSLWPHRPKSTVKTPGKPGKQPEALRKHREEKERLKQAQNNVLEIE